MLYLIFFCIIIIIIIEFGCLKKGRKREIRALRPLKGLEVETECGPKMGMGASIVYTYFGVC